MWQYSRSITFNYYYTRGSTAVVSHLINTTKLGVLTQYHFKLLLHMWQYCCNIISKYY